MHGGEDCRGAREGRDISPSLSGFATNADFAHSIIYLKTLDKSFLKVYNSQRKGKGVFESQTRRRSLFLGQIRIKKARMSFMYPLRMRDLPAFFNSTFCSDPRRGGFLGRENPNRMVRRKRLCRMYQDILEAWYLTTG